MKKRWILVCHNSSLLGEGVESILTPDDRLHVTSNSFDTQADLYECIITSRPDAVVLEERMLFVPNSDFLERIFAAIPSIRIVAVNPNDNRVSVYDKNEFRLTQGSDLIRAIQLA